MAPPGPTPPRPIVPLFVVSSRRAIRQYQRAHRAERGCLELSRPRLGTLRMEARQSACSDRLDSSSFRWLSDVVLLHPLWASRGKTFLWRERFFRVSALLRIGL